MHLVTLLLACSSRGPVELPVDRTLQGSGNVLILLIDDVGVDKVGAYGAPYAATTPQLDALARQGIRFDNAYAAPLCSPARAQLLTGRHGRRTGIGTITERDSNASELPPAARTLPEALQHAPEPWSNGAIGKWHLAGHAAPDWETHPNRQGFQHFAGTRGNPQYKPDRGYAAWSRNVNGVVTTSDVYLTTGTVDDALARLEELPEPWLLYVAFNAAHVPIHLPPRRLLASPVPRGASGPRQHDAMIEAMDTEIGRLLRDMDQQVLARTTIVALADNGTSRFGLETGQGPPRNRIKDSVYQGGVRVPLIVTGPHVANPGTTEAALVHITDLFPTVLDLAGMPTHGSLELDGEITALDGVSLVPLLRGGSMPDRLVYTELFEPNGPGPYREDRRSVRSATHELVRQRGADELYRIEGWWEGSPDLLANREGPLEPDDQAAYDVLFAELEHLTRTLRYEGR